MGMRQGTNQANMEPPMLYGVQVGLFEYDANAQFLQEQLQDLGYTVWTRETPYYEVIVGNESTLDRAVALQDQLRDLGYDTMIVNL